MASVKDGIWKRGNSELAIRATGRAGIPFSLRRTKKQPMRSCQDFLRRWFEAQEKWSDDQIEKMLYELSHVLFILSKYDQHRAGLGFWQ